MSAVSGLIHIRLPYQIFTKWMRMGCSRLLLQIKMVWWRGITKNSWRYLSWRSRKWYVLLWVETLTSQGDGCSRWSVAGGDDGVLLMVARKTVPTVAVCKRSGIENREDFPLHIILFLFLLFNFCFLFKFCFHFLFFDSFCIFYVYNFWDSRYRRRKTGIFSYESRWFVVFFRFNLSLHFLVACLFED